MSCDFCHERPARETIKGKHVCRPCARTLKPDRQARHLKRQVERTSAAKAKERAEKKVKTTQASAVPGVTAEGRAVTISTDGTATEVQ